jgi:hypothetical protein
VHIVAQGHDMPVVSVAAQYAPVFYGVFLAFADSRLAHQTTASLIITYLKKHHERWRISQLPTARRCWQHGVTLKRRRRHVIFRTFAGRAV